MSSELRQLAECSLRAIRPPVFSPWSKTALLSLFLVAGLLAADKQQPPKYVSVGSLPPGWQVALWRHGDRMEKPGKERLTLAGTVTHKGSATTQFQAIHELPNSVRYQ